jgi:hypothetical protein
MALDGHRTRQPLSAAGHDRTNFAPQVLLAAIPDRAIRGLEITGDGACRPTDSLQASW